jgi:ubiquinone/menaquinone biosynthesis C-methylase UbiE
MTDSTNRVAEGFTDTAADYEDAVRFNIGGAQRLVMSIPPGIYDDVLDVGCGTGWATQAVIDRFHPARVTGVDPSEGMLDEFMAKVGGIEGTEITIAQGDVEGMPVPDGAFDLVICSMAYHWFPRKWDAAKAMARTLKPGGVMAILCSGRGGDQAYREILATLEPPNYVWLGTFDAVQRDIPEMEDYLLQAGLEMDDVWMERRVRHTTVDAYMERMRVVAGHLIGDPSDGDVKAYMDRIEQAMRDASGPRGFTYDFTKLYAIARKP